MKIIEPNVAAFNVRLAAAKARGEVRSEADVSTLRDILYGVIEYRLFHAMDLTSAHIDALLSVAFDGVRP